MGFLHTNSGGAWAGFEIGSPWAADPSGPRTDGTSRAFYDNSFYTPTNFSDTITRSIAVNQTAPGNSYVITGTFRLPRIDDNFFGDFSAEGALIFRFPDATLVPSLAAHEWAELAFSLEGYNPNTNECALFFRLRSYQGDSNFATTGDGLDELSDSTNVPMDVSTWVTEPFTVSVSVENNLLTPSINGVGFDALTSSHGSGSRVGFGLSGGEGFAGDAEILDFTVEPVTAISSQSGWRSKVVAVADQDIYVSADTNPTAFSVATNGEDALAAVTSRRWPDATVLLDKAYFCNGRATDYKVLDLTTDTVSDWVASAGELPVGDVNSNQACRQIVTYRGRVVMTGLIEDPQNVFASAVGDATNFDYNPTPATTTQAWALNVGDLGRVGEPVVALAPYQDDMLIVGMINSLAIIDGDPADGGSVNIVSESVGVVAPQAWCYDDRGTFYFLGRLGLYRMAYQQQPELISRMLPDDLEQFRSSTDRPFIEYDDRREGIMIFNIPREQNAEPSDHYFYHIPTNSFWVEQYPTTHVAYTAPYQDNAISRFGPLFGGFDGYIRNQLDEATDDDGTDYEAWFKFRPFTLAGIGSRTHLDDVLIIMGAASTNTDLFVAAFTGNTPEDALASTPRWRRSLAAGRAITARRPVAGNAVVLQVGSDAASGGWTYDAGAATARSDGRQRKGGKL